MPKTIKQNKQETITLRVTAVEKSMFQTYCNDKGFTLTEFIINSALQKILQNSVRKTI